MKKKRKFPADVARFFHPEKSMCQQDPDITRIGTHQAEKAREQSCIVVKYGCGPEGNRRMRRARARLAYNSKS